MEVNGAQVDKCLKGVEKAYATTKKYMGADAQQFINDAAQRWVSQNAVTFFNSYAADFNELNEKVFQTFQNIVGVLAEGAERLLKTEGNHSNFMKTMQSGKATNMDISPIKPNVSGNPKHIKVDEQLDEFAKGKMNKIKSGVENFAMHELREATKNPGLDDQRNAQIQAFVGSMNKIIASINSKLTQLSDQVIKCVKTDVDEVNSGIKTNVSSFTAK